MSGHTPGHTPGPRMKLGAEEVLRRSAETDGFWRDGKPRCECLGECGTHLHEDEDGRCIEQHGEKALGFTGDVALTAVNGASGSPRAMCQRCRARYDEGRRGRKEARRTRREKEITDMIPLFGGGAG